LIRKLIVTFFFVGYAPVAPGTAGSLAAVAVCAAAWYLAPPATAGLILAGLAVTLFFIGAGLGGWAENHFGKKDPSPFVLDEVVGYIVAFAPVLLCFPNAGPAALLAIPFFFFRIFDVLKPFPVSAVEAAPGGWGIMLDDVAAGCYAVAASVAGMWLFAGNAAGSAG